MSTHDGPLFSIALAAYNAEATLGDSIESVLAQTYPHFELLITDDGSTDATFQIAEGFAHQDERVHVFTQPHEGCAAARANSATRAQGEFVMKMDADDTLEPFTLERLAAFIQEEPGYDIYSATGTKRFSGGELEPFFIDPRFSRPTSLTIDDLLDDCLIFGGAATIKRSTLESIGGFRPGVYCEDYDVWLRALARGATHRYTPQSLYIYNFGTADHMNEDPTKSLRSFVAIFEDLIDSGVLDEGRVAHAQASIEKFKDLIAQYDQAGATQATFTNKQARVFRSRVFQLFGNRGGDLVMGVASKLKFLVRPFRVASAKRQQAKAAKQREKR